MSYQPLHHKYRPQTFANLVGQEAIAATLTNAIQQQRIAPAYLFTGARGTGKTSSARILAKSLNCLKSSGPTATPCGQCEVCRAIANSAALDVIEIDAASNTGVDNIRELIERAQFAPVQCRYKVYVVDECHMLSTAAFNALLKTLEEPPDRVVFVLATTDPQRVLPTIISRCQRFDFRRIPLDSMVAHLRHIATKEAIAITDDAITLVAQISQGGLRDAESLLDQLSLLGEEVTVDKVWDLVGSVPERDLMSLLEAIATNDPETLLDSTRRLMDRGREPLIVLQNLAGFYRDLLIAKTAPQRGDLVALTPPTWEVLCEFALNLDLTTILAGQQQLRSAEVQLKNTTQPRLWLEVTLMGLLPSAIQRESPRDYSPPTNTGNHRSAVSNAMGKPAASLPATSLPAISLPTSPATVKPAEPAPAIASPSSITPSPAPAPVEAVVRPETPSIAAVGATNGNSTPPPSAPDTSIDLSQTWQQIIAHLHPLSKALLNEHGQLLAFSGQDARIGISSENLVKIAQNQVKNIEKAFLEVFKRQVKVSLEVAGPVLSRGNPVQSHMAPPTGYPPDAAAGSGHSPISAKTTPSSTYSTQPSPPLPGPPAVADTPRSHPAPSPQPYSEAAFSPPPPPLAAPAPVSNPPIPTLNVWEEDSVIRAAKQLAEFFGGRVVTDDDSSNSGLDLDISATQAGKSSLDQWEPADDDRNTDDDNVPF